MLHLASIYGPVFEHQIFEGEDLLNNNNKNF